MTKWLKSRSIDDLNSYSLFKSYDAFLVEIKLFARWETAPIASSSRLYNYEVAGPNPVPATCFEGSEIRLPSGYTKGRHLRMSAFLRSIASSGYNL